MLVENIIPQNMIINLGYAAVDNHIPHDDIFDYHPLRECNIFIIYYFKLHIFLYFFWGPIPVYCFHFVAIFYFYYAALLVRLILPLSIQINALCISLFQNSIPSFENSVGQNSKS